MNVYKKDPSFFSEIEHTADCGIAARGETLEAAFANTAFGMLHIVGECDVTSAAGREPLALSRPSLPDLLIGWLSEINYLLLVHRFYMTSIQDLRIKSQNDSYDLSAILVGGEINWDSFSDASEIKAVTYHQLSCQSDKNGYSIRVFFDL